MCSQLDDSTWYDSITEANEPPLCWCGTGYVGHTVHVRCGARVVTQTNLGTYICNREADHVISGFPHTPTWHATPKVAR